MYFEKKSCQICPKILKISDFLNFPKSQNGRKWPELADNYSKTSALPQSLSKIFFVSQTQKFMKIFQKNHPPPPPKKSHFLGGGVMILNVVFAGFDAAWMFEIFFSFFDFTPDFMLCNIFFDFFLSIRTFMSRNILSFFFFQNCWNKFCFYVSIWIFILRNILSPFFFQKPWNIFSICFFQNPWNTVFIFWCNPGFLYP